MKYKILKNDHIEFNHPTTKRPTRLYRILAMKTFETKNGTVREGSIGGFIQDETNLNQNDFSWVFNTAKIFGNALLIDSVLVDDAAAFENAIIQDSVCRLKSQIHGDATIINSLLTNNCTVAGTAKVEDSRLFDSCRVWGQSSIRFSELHDGVAVRDQAKVTKCILRDTTTVSGVSVIEGCQYSGHTIVNNSKHANETKTTDLQLNIEQQVLPDSTTF